MNSIWPEMWYKWLQAKSAKRKAKTKKLILAFSFSLFALVRPASAQQTDTLTGFGFDIHCFQTQKFSPDSARADIYIAVPYTRLKFLNAGEKYVADYEVHVSVFDKRTDSLVRSRVQPLTVMLLTSEWDKLQELDLTRADASQYPFTLAQGSEYEVKIEIKDLTTLKEMRLSRTFKVLSFPPSTP